MRSEGLQSQKIQWKRFSLWPLSKISHKLPVETLELKASSSNDLTSYITRAYRISPAGFTSLVSSSQLKEDIKNDLTAWANTVETSSVGDRSSISITVLDAKVTSLLQLYGLDQKQLPPLPTITISDLCTPHISIAHEGCAYLRPEWIAREFAIPPSAISIASLLHQFAVETNQSHPTLLNLRSDDSDVSITTYHLLLAQLRAADVEGNYSDKLRAASMYLRSLWSREFVQQQTIFGFRISILQAHGAPSLARTLLLLHPLEGETSKPYIARFFIRRHDEMDTDERRLFEQDLAAARLALETVRSPEDTVAEIWEIFKKWGRDSGRNGVYVGGKRLFADGPQQSVQWIVYYLLRRTIRSGSSSEAPRSQEERDFIRKEMLAASVRIVSESIPAQRDGKVGRILVSGSSGLHLFFVPDGLVFSKFQDLKAYVKNVIGKNASADHVYQLSYGFFERNGKLDDFPSPTMYTDANMQLILWSENFPKLRYPFYMSLLPRFQTLLSQINPHHANDNSPEGVRIREIAVRIQQIFDLSWARWWAACDYLDRLKQGLKVWSESIDWDIHVGNVLEMTVSSPPVSLIDQLKFSPEKMAQLVDADEARINLEHNLPSAKLKLERHIRPGRRLNRPFLQEDAVIETLKYLSAGYQTKHSEMYGAFFKLSSSSIIAINGTDSQSPQEVARFFLNLSKSRDHIHGHFIFQNVFVAIADFIDSHADALFSNRGYDSANPKEIYLSDPHCSTIFYSAYSKSTYLSSVARLTHRNNKGAQIPHVHGINTDLDLDVPDSFLRDDAWDRNRRTFQTSTFFWNTVQGTGDSKAMKESINLFLLANLSLLGLQDRDRFFLLKHCSEWTLEQQTSVQQLMDRAVEESFFVEGRDDEEEEDEEEEDAMGEEEMSDGMMGVGGEFDEEDEECIEMWDEEEEEEEGEGEGEVLEIIGGDLVVAVGEVEDQDSMEEDE